MVRLLSARAGRLPPAVIHCFTGTVEQAQKYIDMGLYIGLTGASCVHTRLTRVLRRFLLQRTLRYWRAGGSQATRYTARAPDDRNRRSVHVPKH